jgi:hypothetical protein
LKHFHNGFLVNADSIPDEVAAIFLANPTATAEAYRGLIEQFHRLFFPNAVAEMFDPEDELTGYLPKPETQAIQIIELRRGFENFASAVSLVATENPAILTKINSRPLLRVVEELRCWPQWNAEGRCKAHKPLLSVMSDMEANLKTFSEWARFKVAVGDRSSSGAAGTSDLLPNDLAQPKVIRERTAENRRSSHVPQVDPIEELLASKPAPYARYCWLRDRPLRFATFESIAIDWVKLRFRDCPKDEQITNAFQNLQKELRHIEHAPCVEVHPQTRTVSMK